MNQYFSYVSWCTALYPVVLQLYAGQYTLHRRVLRENLFHSAEFSDESLYAFQFASVSAIGKIWHWVNKFNKSTWEHITTLQSTLFLVNLLNSRAKLPQLCVEHIGIFSTVEK